MSHQTKVARWIAYFTFALVLVIAALVAVTAPAVIQSRDNVSQVQRGNELAGCRSEHLVSILDGVTRVLLTQSEGLEAYATDDMELLARSVEQIQEDREATRRAMLAYSVAVQRSSENPDAFLEECRG